MSERVIIPYSLQKKILKQIHIGHPGIVRMKSIARSYVYWPNIDRHIEDLVRQCNGCSSAAKAPPKALLSSWPSALKPWSRIHVDYAGPFEGRMFLVVVDSFSKWPEIRIHQQSTASATSCVNYLRVLVRPTHWSLTMDHDLNRINFEIFVMLTVLLIFTVHHIILNPMDRRNVLLTRSSVPC